MKKYSFIIALLLVAIPFSCQSKDSEKKKEEEKKPVVPTFAKGGDISWITLMEANGNKFYDSKGAETECTALLHSIGFNAVRYRVWVNPADGYCNKEDVLVKARRAQALGMAIMIDFHYSDSWADPGKQPVPAAWSGHDVNQLSGDVFDHTLEVLNYLKDNGIDVAWVQVGNEVTNGMLWETCRVQGQDATNFVKCFQSGYSAVKRVYPNALVILHIDNGWKLSTLTWFFDLMTTAGANYDMIGLSLYPSYWQEGGYPDWREKTVQFTDNLPALRTKYGKEIMLCEFGMPASQPVESKEALQYIIDKTKGYEWFKGIFLWEPESEASRIGYPYGAFSNGTPTIALQPFAN